MALLPIIRFPNPNLRKVAQPVKEVTNDISKLIDDMFETMYDSNGVGLAATQVDIHKRVVVLDCSGEEQAAQPIAFINPEIITASEEMFAYQEGCLSIPENYADIKRPKTVTIKALDKTGKPFTLECEGLLAVCIQHEIDHLNGKLFIDYLSSAKQLLIRQKMKKYEKKLLKQEKS